MGNAYANACECHILGLSITEWAPNAHVVGTLIYPFIIHTLYLPIHDYLNVIITFS